MVEGPKRLGALAEADQRRLEATEALAISEMEGPDGILELLDEWSLHWQLRDAAQAAEERDAADPQEGFIYLKEDFRSGVHSTLQFGALITEELNCNAMRAGCIKT